MKLEIGYKIVNSLKDKKKRKLILNLNSFDKFEIKDSKNRIYRILIKKFTEHLWIMKRINDTLQTIDFYV